MDRAFPTYDNFHPKGKLTEEFPCHVVEAIYADRLDECGIAVRFTGMTDEALDRWPEGFLFGKDAVQLAQSIRAAQTAIERYVNAEVMKIHRGEREPDGPNPHEED